MDERVGGALAALVAYILWRRGVIQNAWGALWGSSQRQSLGTDNQSMIARLIASGTANDTAQNIGTATYPGSPIGDEWTQSGCNRGNYSCLHAWQQGGGVNPTSPTVGGTDIGARIVAAEPAGLANTIAQYGKDLYYWCLAWVNKTRQAAGLSIGPYGAETARGACDQLSLRPGVAPAGATVCFSGVPGHIGIADGGNSYTSAGTTHGGLSRLPYIGNPAYQGWTF